MDRYYFFPKKKKKKGALLSFLADGSALHYIHKDPNFA